MAATSYRSVGRPIRRIDTVSKLTGQAVFAEDFRLPQAPLHGAVLRSPHPHARLARIDTARAQALPGVHAVVTAADLPHRRFGQYIKDEEYLSWERLRYVGDRFAAVAADTPEIARAACALIDVSYQVLPTLDSARAALAQGAPAIHPELESYTVVAAAKPAGGNVASLNELSRGDPETGFAQSARVFEETYTTEMVHQAYLEPHACQAVYNPDGTYTVWSSTQGQYPLRNMIAEVLGVPQNHVRVVPTEVGGGFGGKIQLQDEAVAAALARKAGRPVRIVMTREEDFLCGNPRSAFEMHIKTGVSAEGKLLARTFDMTLDSGAHGLGGVLMAWSLPQFAEGPYAIPNIRITARCVYTNKPPCSSFRAPGGPQANFAVESEMERIAEAMGWDAIAFRRRNAMPHGHKTLAGVEMRSVNVHETLDAALELAGYDPARVHPGPHRGRGIALGNWNVGGMPSGAVLKLNDDGSASILTGVVDLTGVHTAIAQVAAEALQLPPERVTIKALDTESAPHSTISAGSQALKSMGGAVLKAAEHVKAQLFEEAVESLDVTPERMELVEDE
ncbi:MAG TPA: xanthine dehydrogenase family protein molybdopterin-binding subunit, partial [bacterium]